MNHTTYYNFNKPEGTDIVDVSKINENFDTVDIELHKVTNDLEDAIKNIGTVYSTSERVIGKWVDGKPLYQKTIVANNIAYGTEIAHGIDNLDKCVNGIYYLDTGGEAAYGSVIIPAYLYVTATTVKNTYSVNWSAKPTRTFYITLQYTKTTD